MPQVYLIDLTCTSCGQTNTQTVTDTYTEALSQRVRVDTQCTCGAVHWYTLDVEDRMPVWITQADLLDIPF